MYTHCSHTLLTNTAHAHTHTHTHTHTYTPKQAAKALANLGVNVDNKVTIAQKGGISPLIQLADCGKEAVQVEAVAALANLAVNDDNEIEIGQKGTYE